MIHAEVGDSILIVFKNKANRPFSISAQGVENMDSGKQLQVPITKPGKLYQKSASSWGEHQTQVFSNLFWSLKSLGELIVLSVDSSHHLVTPNGETQGPSVYGGPRLYSRP